MLTSDIQRLDEQLAGVEWAAASQAEDFTQIDGTQLRIIKTIGEPHLRIYFRIAEDDVVDFEWIEPYEDAPEEDHS